MKKLVYFRHSLKDGDAVSKEGFELIKKMMKSHVAQIMLEHLDGKITDLFYGFFFRTLQSLVAAISTLNEKIINGAFLHPIIEKIGTPEKFSEIATDKFKIATKSGLSNLEAARQTMTSENFEAFLEWSAEGVEKMFSQMKNSGNGLVFGHSPVIEAAVEYFRFEQIKKQLQPCGFYVFLQDNSGKITVEMQG
jgi:hypothetical protein